MFFVPIKPGLITVPFLQGWMLYLIASRQGPVTFDQFFSPWKKIRFSLQARSPIFFVTTNYRSLPSSSYDLPWGLCYKTLQIRNLKICWLIIFTHLSPNFVKFDSLVNLTRKYPLFLFPIVYFTEGYPHNLCLKLHSLGQASCLKLTFIYRAL